MRVWEEKKRERDFLYWRWCPLNAESSCIMTFMVHSMQQFKPQCEFFFIHLINYHLTKSLKKPEPETRINITLPLIKTPLDPLTYLMTHYVLEMCIVEITSTFQIKKGRFQLMKLGCWTTLLYIKNLEDGNISCHQKIKPNWTQ